MQTPELPKRRKIVARVGYNNDMSQYAITKHLTAPSGTA